MEAKLQIRGKGCLSIEKEAVWVAQRAAGNPLCPQCGEGLSVPWPQGEASLRRAPRPQGPRSEEAVGLAVQGLMPSVPWAGCRNSPQNLEVLVPPEEKTPHNAPDRMVKSPE